MKSRFALLTAVLAISSFAVPLLATKEENKGACEYSYACILSDWNDVRKTEKVSSSWLCEQDPKLSCPDHVSAVVKRIQASYERNTKKHVECYETDRRWTPDGNC